MQKRLKDAMLKISSRNSKSSKNELSPLLDSSLAYRKVAELKESSTWPNLYYSTIDALVAASSAEKFLEIGVAYGWHCWHLNLNFPQITYVGVDPYVSAYDENDDFARHVQENLGGAADDAMNLLFEIVQKSFMTFNNSRIIRTTSNHFFDSNTENFDFVFVDGNHKFDFVTRDLEGSWSALHKGGILAGDDYYWPEVRNAVEEFAARVSRKVHFASNSPKGYPVWYLVR